MLFSKSFIFTQREDPKIAECKSHQLLLKGNFLLMISSGIYSYLPLGWRVLNNINNIIRKHMNSSGAQELLMSAMQPMEIWEKTGRDKDLQEVMFRFKDRKQKDLCLGPTHEEEITEIARRCLFSYKQLPQILYQIQTKFRDELRPRFGIMRSCEFIMKDAYSFDRDEKALTINYNIMLKAYHDIFTECGLNFVKIEADSGVMGGGLSHEFMVPADIGEDVLCFCSKCLKYFKDTKNCPSCSSQLEERRMVEVGHVFKLGTKYSLAQEAFFVNESGKREPFIMGCYGIGVSRLLAAIAETSSDEKGIIWPKSISPFDLTMTILGKSLLEDALVIKSDLEKAGFSVLADDRDESAGVKFKDAYLIGNPYIVIMGKKYKEKGILDLEIRKTGEKLSVDYKDLISFLKKDNG